MHCVATKVGGVAVGLARHGSCMRVLSAALATPHKLAARHLLLPNQLEAARSHRLRCSRRQLATTAQGSGSDASCNLGLHERFMREALAEARKADAIDEVPVGAVIVTNGEVIARGHNATETLRDPTAHAELACIRQAATRGASWRLNEATLYVTLEPCPMCAGALLGARVGTLVYGARNPLLGADGSWISMLPGDDAEVTQAGGRCGPVRPHPFHPKMEVVRGVLQEDCGELMRGFFRRRRLERSGGEGSASSGDDSGSIDL